MPGDVLVFHYSGHGSQMPSKKEPDGFEEIICPIDLNWTTKVITDEMLKQIFNRVPNGVNTTVILDCCHSGTGLNQESSLSSVTKESVVVLSDSEPGRYLAPPQDIAEVLGTRELVEWHASRDVNASALLIAGCHAEQTSADAFIGNSYQGAATASILKAVGDNSKITYRDLIGKMGDFMSTNKYTQNPQLDGSPSLYDEIFCEPFGAVVAFSPAPVVLPPAEVKKSDPIIPIIVAAIIALIAFIATR